MAHVHKSAFLLRDDQAAQMDPVMLMPMLLRRWTVPVLASASERLCRDAGLMLCKYTFPGKTIRRRSEGGCDGLWRSLRDGRWWREPCQEGSRIDRCFH